MHIHSHFYLLCFALTRTALQKTLQRNQPHSPNLSPSLFALTGQSNISNFKCPPSIFKYASSLGYHVLLDAAALAPTTMFSLSDTPVDAMAVSFYKMFGFPTGIGALIVRKSFLELLKRPWFSGGNVDIVQVPGTIFTRTTELHEQFEVNFCLLTYPSYLLLVDFRIRTVQ
jgi:molybdenum cofactor sulfurtransferase